MLDDGRVLSWTAMLDRGPGRVACFRLDGRPIHHVEGARLLRASGYPDGALLMPEEGPARGLHRSAVEGRDVEPPVRAAIAQLWRRRNAATRPRTEQYWT